MTQTSKSLELLAVYSRNELKDMFNIIDATINTGVFQPQGHKSIWLFITENKSPDRTQYVDFFDGQVLNFEGQTLGKTDNKIIEHIANGNEILVFYRKAKSQYDKYAFKYLGRFEYLKHNDDKPKKFVLQSIDLIANDDSGKLEAAEDKIVPMYTEGQLHTRIQTYNERNPRLRAEALKIHGSRCVACGFDFFERYGQHGQGYIEIHHLNPISSYGGDVKVNPKMDLVPLCSNCHRMIHRKEEMLTVDELRRIIK